jgi:hypothetical protein
MSIQTPYKKFADQFISTANGEDFTNDKIKIFQLQTGGGKSYFQDKEMPIVLKKAFPELQYIFRLSPTNEVAQDGTFTKVEELSGEYNFAYADDPIETFLYAWKNVPNGVLCISCTHTYFTVNFERLLKYAPVSILCVEEAHQFIGCGDKGSNPYMTTFGYSSEYTAETFRRIERWNKINSRIIGFTATPTLHHKGYETLSNKFQVCSELASLEEILPSQSWINTTTEYPYAKYQGNTSIVKPIQASIDTIFDREAQLLKLTNEDKNILPKLSGLFIAGDRRGVWGCPIDQVREIISDYLLSIGYADSEKMIATMVEDSSGGVRIYNLKGETERVRGGASELFDRLQDPNDPVRFLIVINRGRSGINVHNLSTCVVCRIRDPKEVRTPIPIQIFGRMVRLNTGTGDIVRKKYDNHLMTYIPGYSMDYGVSYSTIVKTISIANCFDIWYPENPSAKRTWRDSLQEFKELYVNSIVDGYNFLMEFTGEKPLIDLTENSISDKGELICPHCGNSIHKKIEQWAFNGTLDSFFEL